MQYRIKFDRIVQIYQFYASFKVYKIPNGNKMFNQQYLIWVGYTQLICNLIEFLLFFTFNNLIY